jgi:hypothetical protein
MAKGDFKKDCGCKGCSLWLRLEAERRDRSYVPAPKSARPEAVYIRDRKRERMIYDAGRYSGGDRDRDAILAYATYQKEFARV